MDMISTDLVAYIPESAYVAVAATVESVRFGEPAPGIERGVALFVAQAPLSGPEAPTGRFAATFARADTPETRVRQGFNGWNAVALEPGSAMVLIGALKGDATLNAVAGAATPQAGEDLAAAVRAAYDIERRTPAGAAKVAALEQALAGPSDFLAQYAMIAVTERGAVERQRAASMLYGAMKTTAGGRRMELARALASDGIFRAEAKADAVNQGVITALGRTIVAETDQESRRGLAALMAALLMDEYGHEAETAATRRALVDPLGATRRDVYLALAPLAGDAGFAPILGDLAPLLME